MRSPTRTFSKNFLRVLGAASASGCGRRAAALAWPHSRPLLRGRLGWPGGLLASVTWFIRSFDVAGRFTSRMPIEDF